MCWKAVCLHDTRMIAGVAETSERAMAPSQWGSAKRKGTQRSVRMFPKRTAALPVDKLVLGLKALPSRITGKACIASSLQWYQKFVSERGLNVVKKGGKEKG